MGDRPTYRVGSSRITAEREIILEKAAADIRTLYLSGTPLFTKAAISNLHQQLRDLDGKSGTVYIKGLDGTSASVSIQPGQMRRFGHIELTLYGIHTISPRVMSFTNYESQEPFIRYNAIQYLASRSGGSNEDDCYCSLGIDHYATTRDSLTKQCLDIETSQSAQDSRDVFAKGQRQWEESEQCKRLVSALRAMKIPTVSKIVVFACASFSQDLHPEMLKHPLYAPRSSIQHSLALTLQKVLTEKQGSLQRIPYYAQDPVYSDIDKSILRE